MTRFPTARTPDPDPDLIAGPYCKWPRRPERGPVRSLKVTGVLVTLGVIAHCVPPLIA